MTSPYSLPTCWSSFSRDNTVKPATDPHVTAKICLPTQPHVVGTSRVLVKSASRRHERARPRGIERSLNGSGSIHRECAAQIWHLNKRLAKGIDRCQDVIGPPLFGSTRTKSSVNHHAGSCKHDTYFSIYSSFPLMFEHCPHLCADQSM
jgi:hypothetical protein